MKKAKVFFTNNDGTRSKTYNYLTYIEDLAFGDFVIVETGQWYSVATFARYCSDDGGRASKFILQYFDVEKAEALREKVLEEEDRVKEYKQSLKFQKKDLRQRIEHLETYKFGNYDKIHDKLKDVTSYVKKSEVLDEIDKLKLDAPEQKYYAKIKGWEKNNNDHYYWNLDTEKQRLSISTHFENFHFKTKFTKEEWASLGINDTNADFEEVE